MANCIFTVHLYRNLYCNIMVKMCPPKGYTSVTLKISLLDKLMGFVKDKPVATAVKECIEYRLLELKLEKAQSESHTGALARGI